jgi:hypothetical protein
MKRSPMPRPTKPLARKAPVKRENRKRAGERRAKAFGPQSRFCRTLPCCVCGEVPSDPHHEPPRSVGGLDADTVPLCRKCHNRRHAQGAARFWTVDWRAVRDELRGRVEMVGEGALQLAQEGF